jgi:DNA oxidative demethylase
MAPARRRAVPASEAPPGFRYVEEMITLAEEANLIGELESLPWEPVVFRGVTARRRVVHMGHRYDFEDRGVSPGIPIPESLVALRERVASRGDTDPAAFVEVLATEYPPGATIGWHRDAPAFGATVLGVSLASSCRMRFRRTAGDGWQTWEQVLEPRSAYVISGPARSAWYHSIPPTRALRYSITYRTVRERHRSGD